VFPEITKQNSPVTKAVLAEMSIFEHMNKGCSGGIFRNQNWEIVETRGLTESHMHRMHQLYDWVMQITNTSSASPIN
jgi:hypothetical protein